MSAEAAAIARRAAEIQQERGMCKGTLSDDAGHVCMWGAIGEAWREIATTWASCEALREYLSAMFPAAPGTFNNYPGADYNDLPDTTEQDVAKVLLQVADRLEVAS